MIITIASKNPTKIQAVKEVVQDYDFLTNSTVVPLDVDSLVSNQPKTLDEAMQGAINRAKNAFVNCDYSFGLESGMIETPLTRTGNMNLCTCAVYDGQEMYFGISPAFELPTELIDYMNNHNVELNEAIYKCGFTEDRNIKHSTGLIGILTKGKISRKEYMKLAVRFALIGLNSKK